LVRAADRRRVLRCMDRGSQRGRCCLVTDAGAGRAPIARRRTLAGRPQRSSNPRPHDALVPRAKVAALRCVLHGSRIGQSHGRRSRRCDRRFPQMQEGGGSRSRAARRLLLVPGWRTGALGGTAMSPEGACGVGIAGRRPQRHQHRARDGSRIGTFVGASTSVRMRACSHDRAARRATPRG
jgi:hypothetical protein